VCVCVCVCARAPATRASQPIQQLPTLMPSQVCLSTACYPSYKKRHLAQVQSRVFGRLVQSAVTLLDQPMRSSSSVGFREHNDDSLVRAIRRPRPCVRDLCDAQAIMVYESCATSATRGQASKGTRRRWLARARPHEQVTNRPTS